MIFKCTHFPFVDAGLKTYTQKSLKRINYYDRMCSFQVNSSRGKSINYTKVGHFKTIHMYAKKGRVVREIQTYGQDTILLLIRFD